MVDLKLRPYTAWGLGPAQGPQKPNGFWCSHMHSEPSPVNKLCNFMPSYCELPCKFCQSNFLVKIMCKHVLWCLREYTPLTCMVGPQFLFIRDLALKFNNKQDLESAEVDLDLHAVDPLDARSQDPFCPCIWAKGMKMPNISNAKKTSVKVKFVI